MKLSKTQIQKLFLPIVIILIAVVIRVLPHAPNFVPIGAMALFGGAYLSKRFAFTMPLLAMLISDFFLGLHLTMVFVYFAFLATVMIGMFLKKRITVLNVVAASLFTSVIFFLVTNFGVWVLYDFYPKNVNGLFESYMLAIPFFRNTVASDLLYSGLFFGGYAVVVRYILNKKPATV